MKTTKTVLFTFMIALVVFLISNDTIASNNIPTVSNYEDYKQFFVDKVLSNTPSFEVIASNYDKSIYSIDNLINDLDKTTPEISFLYNKANVSTTGYEGSTKRTIKFDMSYKNTYSTLSKMTVAQNIDEFNLAIKNGLKECEKNILVKVTNYNDNDYKGMAELVQNVTINDPILAIDLKSEVGTKYFGEGKVRILEVSVDYYYDALKVKQNREMTMKKASEILASIIKPNMSDYEKELLIHDYIANNCQYDSENYDKKTVPQESRTCYGVLMLKKSVCQGYSSAFKLMLDIAGVSNMIVFGKAKDEEHSWNIVKIQRKYYQVDPTWDDPVTTNKQQFLSHDYFNVTDEFMKKDHIWDQRKYPVCNSVDYSYEAVIEAIKTSREFMQNEIDMVPTSTTTTNTTISNTNANSSGQNKTVIKLYVGSSYFRINDVVREIDPGRNISPVILGNRTLVPIRVVAEALNGTILWDEKTSTVIIKKGLTEIQLKIGSNEVLINGEKKTIEVPASIINGRTFVPIRFISETFGANVSWDKESKMVTIEAL